MTELVSLKEAISDLVPNGSTVAMEGFTHLIPFAAGHEMIRQQKSGLTLVRMTPDVIYDQMIGMGCVSRVVFSWGGNPGVGSLHRFRDAVESGYPHPIEIEEHSHAGMAARYTAGASGLPFGILRGYAGSDLIQHTEVAMITSPFSDEEVAAVPALNPDVTIIHAQHGDPAGNIGMWGITGVQREAVMAANAVIVTVEEIVEKIEPRGPNFVMLPSTTIDAVTLVPGGSHPSYAMGYSTRDNGFYTRWDEISRDRDAFHHWMTRHVLDQPDNDAYLAAVTGHE